MTSSELISVFIGTLPEMKTTEPHSPMAEQTTRQTSQQAAARRER